MLRLQVRGVAYDTKRGYLLKLDFLHAVSLGNAWFGRRQMTAAEVNAAYGAMVVTGAELAAFRPMVDLFCLPEACLISDVIQHFVDRGMPFHPGYVYQDVKAAVGYLHESGVLHNAIAADPGHYIEDSPNVVRLLRSLRAAGRKTFLLTNSGFKFVNNGMNYITRGQLSSPDEWISLFDLVCVGADKPSWYKDDRPFRSLNATSGKVRWVPIEALLPGHVYYGGSFAELNRLTGGGFQGQHVLYLGDHVFSDLSKPSRIGWRTGAIIHELEREVGLQTSPEYRALLATLMETERLLRREQERKAAGEAGGGAAWRMADLRAERERVRAAMRLRACACCLPVVSRGRAHARAMRRLRACVRPRPCLRRVPTQHLTKHDEACRSPSWLSPSIRAPRLAARALVRLTCMCAPLCVSPGA
jgi:HAD superfamily 5'-nucleotidase-like hydrolase